MTMNDAKGKRVDVLAVMDIDGRAVALWADACPSKVSPAWDEHLKLHDEARAAVAQLFEDNRAVLRMLESDGRGDDPIAGFMRAALNRIGGAA